MKISGFGGDNHIGQTLKEGKQEEMWEITCFTTQSILLNIPVHIEWVVVKCWGGNSRTSPCRYHVNTLGQTLTGEDWWRATRSLDAYLTVMCVDSRPV